MASLCHLLILPHKTEKRARGPLKDRLLAMFPVLPVLPAPGLCPKLADFILLPYSRLCRFPLLLFLTIIIHINDKADDNQG